MNNKESKVGDLRVWWIPQVPMKAFRVPVKDTEQAKLILNTLAQYDLFQWRNNIKPDFSNTGGLEVYVASIDGENTPGWEEWENEEGEDINDEDMLV
ncbi:hypothetical protein LCGC14_1064490 [marine sediment metagenome]|uniref:Uncharacterized protein n=1 Tax=marine sediment metagenome TaxID=412755 RepID=A0A0F9Q318_9ZZZZ